MSDFGPMDFQPADFYAPMVPTEKKWLFEKRLDYARSFFDHHAKQRMSMFNFFLLFVSFIIAGFASLTKDGNIPAIANILAGAGVILTITFVCLERRNEELVHIAEDVLESLENDLLFDGYDRVVKLPRRRHPLGWMRQKEQQKWELGIFRRQSADQVQYGRSLYEHGIWLPAFHYVILAIFVYLSGYPHWHTISKVVTTWLCK